MSIMLTVTKEDGLDQEDADAVEAALKELEVEDNDFACKVTLTHFLRAVTLLPLLLIVIIVAGRRHR